MKMSGQLHSSVALPPRESDTGTNRIGGTGFELDPLDKGSVSCSAWNQIPNHPARKH
jgi:hypothetical protein